uniref:Uncharacterized protein n=1 Tax=Chromera velia CCMP2878 TaxID=1169474 RepID=A0A0G4GSK7_9ALVE|eukprot:Cvel_23210.t1-p1 / transcript=Cvel_23210.t1 / gene=Cvel_23210 / organism=Chromera_velia_CCMP2878 / gene_product=hypothetical protein / transcript_product=hypothetical protein / location=Cvel_scaffold2366:16357-18906(+) / protein_length=289 / sequence_SO=supercontig / SO=protein_coding / is_pseudo=false
MDSVLVKGPGLPLFLRSLDRLNSQHDRGEGDGGGQRWDGRLRKFIFAEGSLGPDEAPIIFPLLLRGLESLSLKGNAIGIEGMKALAEEIRSGRASSLRILDLQDVGLSEEFMRAFCEAIKERPFRVKTLKMSGKSLDDEALKVFISALSVDSLPYVRHLVMAACGVSPEGWAEFFTKVVGEGHLRTLESICLERNAGLCSCLGAVGGFLRSDVVPCLKNLNLMTEEGIGDGVGTEKFLSALSAPTGGPPLEDVQVHLRNLNEKSVRALGAGQHSTLLSELSGCGWASLQ